MTTLNTLKAAIEAKKSEIKAKQAEMDSFEIEVSDSDYDESLDSEGAVNVCGMEFYPSDILKNCDPIAYRCGKNDYADSLDKEDQEEYKDLESELEDLENELEDLEAELEEAEKEAENNEENNEK